MKRAKRYPRWLKVTGFEGLILKDYLSHNFLPNSRFLWLEVFENVDRSAVGHYVKSGKYRHCARNKGNVLVF